MGDADDSTPTTVYLIATEAETYVHIPRRRQEDEIGGIFA